MFDMAPRAHFFFGLPRQHWPQASQRRPLVALGHPRRRLRLAQDLELSVAVVEKDDLAAVAARSRMIGHAGVFDAQRTCHDAQMAGWDHVGLLDLTPCS